MPGTATLQSRKKSDKQSQGNVAGTARGLQNLNNRFFKIIFNSIYVYKVNTFHIFHGTDLEASMPPTPPLLLPYF